jgi:hypothetical protein
MLDYTAPSTVEEAVRVLAAAPGESDHYGPQLAPVCAVQLRSMGTGDGSLVTGGAVGNPYCELGRGAQCRTITVQQRARTIRAEMVCHCK